LKALIITDLHGNLAALHAIEKAAGPADRVIFLGDVLDYGPQPKECIAWLRDHTWARLRGNHDHAVLTRVDCQCGLSFKKYSIATRKYMWKILDEADYEYVRPLAPEGRFELDGLRIFAAHAAPSDPLFKYLKPSTPDDELEKEVENINADVVLLGHTHLPMDKKISGVRIVNPGSAGQPRDGDPRAAYAIWQDGNITLHRLEYDIEATCRALATCPLEAEVIERLSSVLRTGN
jgi:putative phosphoesterase